MPVNFFNRFTFLLLCTLASGSFADTYTASDGTQVDYEVTGAGYPLVVLHSGMMSREDLRVLIEYFSEHYKVIAIDAREQGRSSASDTQISYELMARDVVGVLDAQDIEQAYFFGQSDGGITALTVAHRYPDRVSKFAIHGAVFHYEAYSQEQRNGWLNISWDICRKWPVCGPLLPR